MPKEKCVRCQRDLEKKDVRVYFRGDVWKDGAWQNDLEGELLVLCRDCAQPLVHAQIAPKQP